MKVFIAGPRAMKKLDDKVVNRLQNILEKEFKVIVGDSNGVDKLVQEYFYKHLYREVIVFASQGKARNNMGKWEVENVEVPPEVKGFDFYAKKDEAMVKNADYGFMIWNGTSKGTLNNIVNLIYAEKISLIYFSPNKNFVEVDSFDKLEALLLHCPSETKSLYQTIKRKNAKKIQTKNAENQITFFDYAIAEGDNSPSTVMEASGIGIKKGREY